MRSIFDPRERQRLHRRLDTAGECPASDVFGELSGGQWGALLRTHVDHHLRQFGA